MIADAFIAMACGVGIGGTVYLLCRAVEYALDRRELEKEEG